MDAVGRQVEGATCAEEMLIAPVTSSRMAEVVIRQAALAGCTEVQPPAE